MSYEKKEQKLTEAFRQAIHTLTYKTDFETIKAAAKSAKKTAEGLVDLWGEAPNPITVSQCFNGLLVQQRRFVNMMPQQGRLEQHETIIDIVNNLSQAALVLPPQDKAQDKAALKTLSDELREMLDFEKRVLKPDQFSYLSDRLIELEVLRDRLLDKASGKEAAPPVAEKKKRWWQRSKPRRFDGPIN